MQVPCAKYLGHIRGETRSLPFWSLYSNGRKTDFQSRASLIKTEGLISSCQKHCQMSALSCQPSLGIALGWESYLTQGHGFFLVQLASEDCGEKKVQMLRLKAFPVWGLPVGLAEDFVQPDSSAAQLCFDFPPLSRSVSCSTPCETMQHCVVLYYVMLITLPYIALCCCYVNCLTLHCIIGYMTLYDLWCVSLLRM